jgi:hypothetical protein
MAPLGMVKAMNHKKITTTEITETTERVAKRKNNLFF